MGVLDKGSVIRSFSNARVVGASESEGGYNVGGLVGTSFGRILDSYAVGIVIGGTKVGGLVGYRAPLSSFTGDIIRSFAAPSVQGDSTVGGLVGLSGSGSSEVLDSFWDKEKTQQLHSSGVSDDFGKTTVELENVAIFTTDLGERSWDFEIKWMLPPPSSPSPRYPSIYGVGYR